MYFYLLISKGFIIIIIIIIIISHYSSLRPGSNGERTKELFRLTQMIQVRFLIQTSKFISRPQFTFMMYNGPQCLPVKKKIIIIYALGSCGTLEVRRLKRIRSTVEIPM